ncbi:hypothetical protein, partial [Cronobacter sakazakii]|uniref:hypothetical protein n=1 Tax=Cronobacter sakazakii TaxID=28141 RepID=UPI0019581D1D
AVRAALREMPGALRLPGLHNLGIYFVGRVSEAHPPVIIVAPVGWVSKTHPPFSPHATIKKPPASRGFDLLGES